MNIRIVNTNPDKPLSELPYGTIVDHPLSPSFGPCLVIWGSNDLNDNRSLVSLRNPNLTWDIIPGNAMCRILGTLEFTD